MAISDMGISLNRESPETLREEQSSTLMWGKPVNTESQI